MSESAKTKLHLRSVSHILATSIAACLLRAVTSIPYAISLATLIFTGSNVKYLPFGIGTILMGYFITGLFISLGSSVPGVISAPKTNICLIFSLMAASITATLQGEASHQILPTILATIIISSIFTGLMLFFIGIFKIGNIIRFIPYPVIGGYFAGAGLLIIKGFIFNISHIPLSMETASKLFEFGSLIVWAPGLLFALIAIGIVRRYKHFYLISIFLLLGFIVFYSVLFMFHIPIDQVSKMGLIMPDYSQESLIPPFHLLSVHDINFSAIISQSSNILIIGLLSAIIFLMSIPAIEITTEKQILLEKDLKIAGIANMFSGVFGGIISFHDHLNTFISYKIGATTRLSGIIFALFCGSILLSRPFFVHYFPTPIISGLLLFISLSIVIEWLYDAWFELPGIDYALVVIIAAIVNFFGFVRGVSIGILVAAIFFILNYSRISVIKFELSGSQIRSKVERPKIHQDILKVNEDLIKVLILQGYIFFGTAQQLVDQINCHANSKSDVPCFIVLDFQLVSGLDISAVKNLRKLQLLCAKRAISLIFSCMNETIREQMEAEGYLEQNEQGFAMFTDIDHALEWCENRLLATKDAPDINNLPLSQQFADIFSIPENLRRFLSYFEPVSLQAGNYLFRQGDLSDSLYFVESGKITILLETAKKKNLRLAVLEGGTILGEMGLYSRMSRSASVVADADTLLHKLSVESFAKIQTEAPHIANEFHHFIVGILTDRIKHLQIEIQAIFK